MRLRNWQQRAIETALQKFKSAFTNFLCLATPGAGKTVMASALADILLKQDKVACSGPFRSSISVQTDQRFRSNPIAYFGVIRSKMTFFRNH
ncbi:DEAD/DEAH box helicase family protein [Alteromonas profundi]|uniref:DEAD/DEAH box helicase family protein n=1 Tax=Alteromonas profundi TaxID=2696062 RepID=UPI001FE91394|nr:DEAD/DEAH box helicase family protein [Alteromonas profundi]